MKGRFDLLNKKKLKALLFISVAFLGFFFLGDRVFATVTCGGGFECDSEAGSCKSSSCNSKIANGAPCFVNDQCLSGICYKDKLLCVDKIPLPVVESTISWSTVPPTTGVPGIPINVEFGQKSSFALSANENDNGVAKPAVISCKDNCSSVITKITSGGGTEIVFNSANLSPEYQKDGTIIKIDIAATSKTDPNNFIVASIRFKITMPKSSSGSGGYSLLQWSNDQDKKTYSISGSNKFACVGLKDGVIDKAIPITGDMGEVGAKLESGQADVSFILGTAEGLAAVGGGCTGINSYVLDKITVKKNLNNISSFVCIDYSTKDECLKNFLLAVKIDTHNHQACFCTSDNGYTKAKCIPNDSKNCQSYLDKDYVKCDLVAADECLAGVAKAVQKDVENYDAKRIEIEESAKSGFNLLGTVDIAVMVGRIIKAIMGITGSIALAMFVYAGILWMTAAGNSEKEEKSKTILLWSTLGVVVIFASYALLNFVFEILK